MKHVVVTESLHPDGIALLEARKDVRLTLVDGDPVKLSAALGDAHGVLVRTMMLSESQLQIAKNLEVVSRHGVGCDNIDVAYLSARGIPVAIAADSNTTSVIEHVMMMMLTLNKRVMQYDQLTRNGQFSQRGSLHTSELSGKSILIIGFGRIGKRVAPLCKAFNMRVTVADIALDRAYAKELGVDAVDDFRPLLSDSDYVTLHVPLNDSTTNLIDSTELHTMSEHSILINCARGGVVSEEAVAAAIVSGDIAGFGSDVFLTEPPASNNPLLSLPNTVLTPHNAASTVEGMQRMATYSAQNILDQFDGKLTDERIINAHELR